MEDALVIIEGYRPGVLSKPQLQQLEEAGVFKAPLLDDEREPTIDLHLGYEYCEMKGCIKGMGKPYTTILSNDTFIKSKMKKLENDEPKKLKKTQTYIFKLQEGLNFGNRNEFKWQGRATGKSSIGRIDVLARLITENSFSYDEVKHENPGTLYLEITPITFDIIIEPGVLLNQLRLFRGAPELSEIKIQEIEEGFWGHVINDEEGSFKNNEFEYLKLNLNPDRHGGQQIIAFQAKLNTSEPIDLTKDFKEEKNQLDPKLYWEPISPKRDNIIEIEKDKFYLLRSKERFKLPNDVAVYCEAVSEELGEIRIHYAGFVHPGFGTEESGRKDGKGAPLIFEVRGHTLKTFLQDGETLARLRYYRMSQPQEIGKQHYAEQELNLSKYFKAWE